MTKQQPYTVVRSYDAFELRRYPAHLLAEVTIDGDFEDAGNRAFRDLFGYITGENTTGGKVSMTAPVLQQAQQASGYQIAFVLPSNLTLETAPQPTNPRVALRAVPESVAAALRYGGRWTESSYQRHREQLETAVASAGLTPVGTPRFARFDPPFTPWFLRRNEIVLDVAASG